MNIRYYVERIYPYVIALVAVCFLIKFKINYVSSENMNDAIDGVITITSLIIGFIGAVLPIVMSMKNDSKFVQYVFEKDENKLFLKYIKVTLFHGIVLILISIVMYFKDEYIDTIIYGKIFYVWILFLILFLISTYRCTCNMLNLIFTDGNKIIKNVNNIDLAETDREKKFRERLEKEEK
ncbi:MAG: hypothetical protein J6B50_08090 [Lachnospiraceae bacterium]|nr:hypothetical protein [Lachnospiraceae bacterium]